MQFYKQPRPNPLAGMFRQPGGVVNDPTFGNVKTISGDFLPGFGPTRGMPSQGGPQANGPLRPAPAPQPQQGAPGGAGSVQDLLAMFLNRPRQPLPFGGPGGQMGMGQMGAPIQGGMGSLPQRPVPQQQAQRGPMPLDPSVFQRWAIR